MEFTQEELYLMKRIVTARLGWYAANAIKAPVPLITLAGKLTDVQRPKDQAKDK